MKPGYKTTEFWITAILIAATTIMPYAEEGTPLFQVLVFITAGLAAAGYSISRSLAKRK